MPVESLVARLNVFSGSAAERRNRKRVHLPIEDAEIENAVTVYLGIQEEESSNMIEYYDEYIKIMIAKNYIELPTEGLVRGNLLDEGNAVTVYLDIHEEESSVPVGNPEEGKTETATVKVGYPVRCLKPVSRDALINAAEMLAYGLRDAMAMASFNASLARKWREDDNDSEVKEHDKFISWVKDELTKAGI